MSATVAATPAGRRAWLEWRRQGIGASDAAAITGLDPYRGPMSVWLSKTGLLPNEDDDDVEYRRWGNLLEPAIAEEFERRTGIFVLHRALMLEHRDLPWMRATIDGVVHDSRDNGSEPLGVLEIKTVAGFKDKRWADAVPEHFQIQVQHQLAVTGLQHAWLAVLFGGQRLELYELERDDELIQSLIDLEEAFWKEHVLRDVPPAGDGFEQTTEDLRRAFAAGGGEPVALSPAAETLIQMRAQAKESMKFAERACREAEQALQVMLGVAEVGLVNDRPRVTWKPQTRKEHVVRASTFRVLRIVGEEDES